MKKIQFTLAALMFVFAACNTQEFVPSEGSSEEGKLTTVTIKASNGDADTKAAISDGLAFTWTTGDKIAVHTDAGQFYTSDELAIGGTTADFTVSLSGTRDGFAVYPASVAKSWSESTLTLTLPNTYTYAQVSGDNTPLPMIATNTTGAPLNFYHVAGLFRVTVKAIPSDATGLVFQFPGSKVNGDFTISSPTAGTSTITTSAPEDDEDKITVTFDAETATEMTLNIPLPTGAYEDVYITPVGSETKVASARHIAAGGYTAARAHGKKLTTTLVSFTINDSNGKVVFAPGNLQAVFASAGSSCTWKFADNQFDTVGAGEANTSISGPGSVSTAGTFDLFGWVGDAGTYNSYGINIGDVDEYGDYHDGRFWPEPLKNDWGVLPIGSYASDTWRTLSADGDNNPSNGEWNYLILSRGGDMFAQASVNGKNGVIIFPDNYVHPTGPSSPNNVNTPVAWDKDDLSEYTANEWQVLEGAGCIFLPCGGYRHGNNEVIAPDTYASYWSTTVGNRVVIFYASGGQLDACHWQSRQNGSCVRLVRDLN